MRAFAVIAVVFSHTHTILPGGGVGVDVFFAISGYIITAILIDEVQRTGTISLRAFYIRRIVRLWPALFALLAAVTLVVGLASAVDGADRTGAFLSVAAAALSVMNWVRAFDLASGGYLGHTWSLAVEEQFYLIWPTMLVFILRWPRRRAVLVLVSAAVVVAFWRGWLGQTGQVAYAYHALETRADGLILGSVLAIVGAERFRALARFWPIPFLYLVTVFGIGGVWGSELMFLGGLSLIAISSTWLVCACVVNDSPLRPFLATGPAVWIGNRSYSLYLWHYPILSVLQKSDLPTWQTATIGVIGSVVMADLSYRFIEIPFQQRRRRRLAAA